ncbi:hypothetical protein DSUL_50311 [Desulfovibrionales bacterium]
MNTSCLETTATSIKKINILEQCLAKSYTKTEYYHQIYNVLLTEWLAVANINILRTLLLHKQSNYTMLIHA